MAGTFQVGQRAARSLPERWPAVLPWVSFLSGGEEHYDVLADGTVVGRIMMFADTPAGKPWMWSLAYGQHEDRTLPSTSRPERPPCRHSRGAGTGTERQGNREIRARE